MEDLDSFKELLAVDQATQLTDRAVGFICDAAVADGLRFSQSIEGLYSVEVGGNVVEEIPAQHEPETTSPSRSQEIPPHDERYVTVQLGADGTELRYVGVSDVHNFGRANGLNLNALRTTFKYVLRWSPHEHVIKDGNDVSEVYNNCGFNRVGFRLNALPLVLRAVKKTDSYAIYPDSSIGSREKKEKSKELFIAFSEAVLTPPEE